MTKLGLTREECIEALRSYLADIDEILKLLEFPMDIKRIKDAQDLLKKLKERFESDFKPRETVRKGALMSEIERENFFPAITDAKSGIRVHVTSQPDINWHRQLSDARDDIDFVLRQLESPQ